MYAIEEKASVSDIDEVKVVHLEKGRQTILYRVFFPNSNQDMAQSARSLCRQFCAHYSLKVELTITHGRVKRGTNTLLNPDNISTRALSKALILINNPTPTIETIAINSLWEE